MTCTENFKKWIENIKRDFYIERRMDTLKNDFESFERFFEIDPSISMLFQRSSVMRALAYREILFKVEKQDLWKNYAEFWDPKIKEFGLDGSGSV